MSLAAFILAAAATTGPAGAQQKCPPALAAQIEAGVVVCQVLVEGALDPATGTGVAYRLYRWISLSEPPPSPLYNAAPYNQTAVTLAKGEKPDDPFWARWIWHGIGWFETPYIAANPQYGDFLVVPGRYAGTGAGVEDHVFLPDRASGWTPVRASAYDPETGQGWLAALSAELPPGYQIWKGIRVDYETLTGRSAVWRDGDANCCPSGGEIRFQLRLAGDDLRLEVAEAEYVPPAN